MGGPVVVASGVPRACFVLRSPFANRSGGGVGVRRGATLTVAVAALLAVGCGGGGSSPTATATPPSSGGGDPSAKLVVLDSGNFDALVLAVVRPSLVEFQSPT